MELPHWFETERVYRCFHPLQKKERIEMFRSDLQYDEGRFWLVLEWQDTHDGEIPSVRVPLDEKWLEPPLSASDDWVYQVPVELPR